MPDFRALIRARVAASGLRPEQEAEVVEELAQHLEDLYEQALAGGSGEEEARRVVLRELDGSALLSEELRRARRPARREPLTPGAPGRRNLMGDIWQDLRYGLRVLLKNPGFTAVAVAALALGIGANSAIFSVVNTVLLRPLPYAEPERLVTVWEDRTSKGYPRDTPAAGNFVDWRDQSKVFEGMAAVASASFNLTGDGEPERIEGRRVSAALFPLLGVEPQLGRFFTAEEDQPGAGGAVVIGHGLWQRRFGGDPSVVGRTVALDGQPHTVVGVMPAHFQYPTRQAELWAPIAFTPQQAANRNRHYLEVVARLKPGVTLEQAQAELGTIAARLQQQFPDSNNGVGAAVVPLHEHLVGDVRPALLVLLGAVGLVLLIACANVANLLLARAATRQKEIALRVALGASRARLLRQFLTESLLLASVGGVVGLLLAVWGVNLLRAFIPENVSQAAAISIDARVLVFTLGVSLVTGLVFGLAPSLQASKFTLSETLKEGGRGSTGGRGGNLVRSALVVFEVAISLVLLVGAGLLINSFLRLSSVDPGFRADNLLTMQVVLPPSKYPDHARRSAFYDQLLQRVAAVPGVKSATVANWIPLVRQGDSVGVSFEGQPPPAPGQAPSVVTRVVSPDYFETMGMRLLRGRAFGGHDRVGSPAVAVIGETMARKHWPGEDPVGKRITTARLDAARPEDWITVVGVVNDVRQRALDSEPVPQMYLSYAQAALFAPRYLIVRTGVEPHTLAATVRQTVWEVDKDQPVSDIRAMEEVLSESIGRQRFSMLLFGIFAGVALLLAAVGIYGVMSYAVAQRTHEIGIRMALGAQRSDVLRLAVGQGLKLVFVGVAVGLGASFALMRFMESLLFGVTATDPATLVVIPVVLIAVAALASYVPARRASKVDPLVALRCQ